MEDIKNGASSPNAEEGLDSGMSAPESLEVIENAAPVTENAEAAENVAAVPEAAQEAENPQPVTVPQEDAAKEAASAAEEESAANPGKKKNLVLFTAIGIVAVFCVCYLGLCVLGNTKEVDTQYEVNGVNITGMSREEASAAVQKQFENAYSDASYEVGIEDLSFKIPVFDYLSIDPSEGIEKALSYDGGPWIGRGIRYIRSRISGVDTIRFTAEPVLADPEGLAEDAKTIADTVFQKPVDPEWKEENGKVSVTLGEAGRSVDAEKIADEIAAGIAGGDYSGSVSASFVLAEPKNPDISAISKAVYLAPKDAAYSLKDNALEITDSETGKELTEETIRNRLKDAKPGTTIMIEETVLQPELTSDALREMLLADLISSYQVIDGGSWTQINNQGIACESVTGTIVMPGDVFSFNDLVGDTTPDKGYVQDYAYENNKLVLQYGGGICRVASTLYAAVLYSDLEVVSRNNHTSPVHYLPLGMDATVSYPEPDLMFRNNRKFPIQIFMYLGDGYVHAEIYGTHIDGEPNIDVELNYQTSMLVDTYRNYYSAETGELLSTEYMHTSSYRDLIPDPTPTPTPAPTATPAAEPTTEPDAEPTAEPTPEPTAEPIPEPTEAPEPPEEQQEPPEENTEENGE